METKRCPYCGETLPNSSTFCPACFQEIAVAVSEKQPSNLSHKYLLLCSGIIALVLASFFFCFFLSNKQETTLPISTPTLAKATTQPSDTTTMKNHTTPTTTVATTTTATLITTATVTITPVITNTPTATLTATPSLSSEAPTKPSTASANPIVTFGPTSTIKPTPTITPISTIKPTVTQSPTPRPTAILEVPETVYDYMISDGTAIITGYHGYSSVLYVPETLAGYPVVSVSDTFRSNGNVIELYLPETTQTLDGYAFSGCKNLEKVYIPDSITKIPEGLFYQCKKLSEVRLPITLEEIPENCFSGCENLKSITLPNTITRIGDNAFSDSGITNIAIPATVTEMQFAFLYANKLESIEVVSGNPRYCSIDGVLFEKHSETAYTLLVYPDCKKDTSYIMPPIANSIFTMGFAENRYLEDITLSPQTVGIGHLAFWHCESLTTVKTYSYLNLVNENAFKDCTNLTNLNLESNVERIGDNAFSGCSNLTLTVEEGSYSHTYAKENNIPYKLK